jgi:acyl phosphate:glycerol-3-phosphate acyltransferase
LILVAAGMGYLVGSLPTAATLGHVWGVDLRGEGSQNPGTNNARRLGGLPLAAIVLAVEIAKGAGSVILGAALSGATGAVVAGVAAVAGNVYNVWYRFEGGKGLGISAGVLAAAWPTVFVPTMVVIIAAVFISRSSGMAALIAVAALNVFALIWGSKDLPTSWGVPAGPLLFGLSIGLTVILVHKHLKDVLRPPDLT